MWFTQMSFHSILPEIFLLIFLCKMLQNHILYPLHEKSSEIYYKIFLCKCEIHVVALFFAMNFA